MIKPLMSTVLSAVVLSLALQGSTTPLSAHAVDKSSSVQSSSAVVKSSSNQQVYNRFEALLSKQEQLAKAFSYLNQNIHKVSRNQATQMTLHLENAQKKKLSKIQTQFDPTSVQEKLNKIYQEGDTITKLIAKTKDASLRKLLTATKNQGFKVETAEGMFFPVLDYSRYTKFRPYVTTDVQAYIDIMKKESDQVPLKDAGIVISHKELVTRSVAMERFTIKYPKSQRIKQVNQLFSQYTFLTFYGTSNTPLFGDNRKIDPDAKKAYLAVLKQNKSKDSQYLTKLNKFMELLSKNKDERTKAVDKFLNKEVPLD